VHVYTDQQCEKIIEAAALFDQRYNRALPWELLVRLALCTAMRRGEILNLTWRDIDFENMTVDVEPKTDTEQTWPWLIKDTDRRTVPLTETVIDMLTQWQAEQSEGYPYVFVSPERYHRIQARQKAGEWTLEHGKCPVTNFYPQFTGIRDRAGVKTGSFHDLRKTCISQWLNSGLEPHEVTKMVGHSCFETTWKFYVSIRKNVLNKAREASDFGTRLAHAPKN
jgi:integrase